MSDTTNDKCPVCGWENAETARDVKVGEAVVRVCCEECAQAVGADPSRYVAH
jgi:ribosome-binding protein aMBF1 (putative translation factor)